MAGYNFFKEALIVLNIFFTDNSKAMVVYSPKTQHHYLVRGSSQLTRQRVKTQPTSKAKTNLPDVKFDKKQVQKKFKHAADFSIEGNQNKARLATYQNQLQAHVNKESTLIIQGKYRRFSKSSPVVHYLDPISKLNVIADKDGRFVSAWKLNDTQFENVKSRGIL